MNVRISDEWRNKLLASGFPPEELCLGVAEEILRRLPDALEKNGEELGLVCQKHSDGSFDVCYQYWPPSHMQFSVAFGEHRDTLVNAAAALYCYLAENGLLPKAS